MDELNEPWHGTSNGYGYHKCRCVLCKKAHSEYVNAWKKAHKDRPIPERVHGTTNGYNNYSCRCQECKTAWAQYFGGIARQRRIARGVPDHVHGTQNGYGNYSCRCDACTKEWSRASGERARKRAANRRSADQGAEGSLQGSEAETRDH